jgi:hypothetical protein
MSRAHAELWTSPPTEPLSRAPALADNGAWQPADGILFSVLSSLVLWSILFTSVYLALRYG